MVYLFLFIIIANGVSFVVQRSIIKKYRIKGDFWIYKHATKKQKWIEYSLFVTMVFVFFVLSNVIKTPYAIIIFLSSFILLFAIRALLEWKYEKGSKRYLLSINNLFLSAVVIIGLLFYMIHKGV